MRFRAGVATVAVLAVAWAGAGCGKKSSTAASKAAVTTSTSAETSTTAAGADRCSAKPITSYPSTGQSYADAIFAAWQRCDGDAMLNYSESEVGNTLRANGVLVGEVWSFSGCAPSTDPGQNKGFPVCKYTSTKSRTFTVTVDPSLLGKPHAVVKGDVTTG